MKKFIYNFLGFIGFCFSEKLVLLSLIGYILILISPMFSWYSSALSYTGVAEELSYNMFQLAGGQIKEKSYIAIGIFIILISVALIAIEYLDYKIKLKSRLDATVILQGLFYVVLVILLIVGLNNETLKEAMSYRSGEIKAIEYWIKEASGHCNNGAGPVLYAIGLGLAVLSKVGVYVYYFIDNVKDSLTTKKG